MKCLVGGPTAHGPVAGTAGVSFPYVPFAHNNREIHISDSRPVSPALLTIACIVSCLPRLLKEALGTIDVCE